MADDDHDHDHDDGHEGHGHGFAIPLPPLLMHALAGAEDRRQMHVQVAEAEVTHFLDSLGVEQLLALRRILCLDNDSSSNNYFDGQVVTLLRVVHKVDITTGQPFDVSAIGGDVPSPEPPAVAE